MQVRTGALRGPRRGEHALAHDSGRLGRRALLAGGAALAAGCSRRTRDERGRVKLRFWYTLGGRNREVLLEIVRRFHEAQDEVRVEAVYQGDYFESLAKLRTASPRRPRRR